MRNRRHPRPVKAVFFFFFAEIPSFVEERRKFFGDGRSSA